MTIKRCPSAGADPAYLAYHDCEWGVPVHGDRDLFEMLTLEGAQAGLSLSATILRNARAIDELLITLIFEGSPVYDSRKNSNPNE